jgi:methylated-DNA-[protein]-cysteine S-methyltransferase
LLSFRGRRSDRGGDVLGSLLIHAARGPTSMTETTRAVETLTFRSPIGLLAIRACGGALVALDWIEEDWIEEDRRDDDGRDASHRRRTQADAPLLRRTRAALAAYFNGRAGDFDLPCAPAGTPFQRRVWAELRRIPFGATVTYGALARRVGSSPRAVGNACGANPLPIVIPCHRVLGAGGALGGYSGFGGTATKAWLLAHESREPALFANVRKRRLAS